MPRVTLSAPLLSEASVSNSGLSFEKRESTDVVLVLGMHRSGTSAVAGVLIKLGGAPPAHSLPANASNPRGHFESAALMEFHEQLLASAGSHWQDWRLFNPAWPSSPVASDYRLRAKNLFEAEFGGAALPVLKDPRICRFVPFWLDVLREMQKAPRIVMPIRSPLDVARSLRQRDGMPLTKGLLLWLRNVMDAEAYSRSEARSIFSWNEFNSDWRRVCDKVGADTGLSWPRLSDRSSSEIDHFLTRELVHYQTDHATLAAHSDVHEWTLGAYEALLELARDPSSKPALDTLDRTRTLLDQSSKLFGRVLVDYEIELEDLYSQSHAVTSERDFLRVRQSETLAELAARTEQAEKALSYAWHDKESLTQTLVASVAERDALRNGLTGLTARAELAEEALSEAWHDKESLSRTLAALLAERDALREEKTAALAELEESRRGAKAEVEGLQQRLADLDENNSRMRAEVYRTEAEFKNELERAYQTLSAERQRAAEQTDRLQQAEEERRALRSQLVDAEAALSKTAADRPRSGRWMPPLPAYFRRRLLAQRLIRSGLFDTSWYCATYPDVFKSGLGAAEHYLEIGFCQGYRPNPLFDTRWYLERYEDIRRSGVNPLLHYFMHGWREGRDPGPDFDNDYYLEANPDVRVNGMNSLMHYLRFGRLEGRLPARPTENCCSAKPGLPSEADIPNVTLDLLSSGQAHAP